MLGIIPFILNQCQDHPLKNKTELFLLTRFAEIIDNMHLIVFGLQQAELKCTIDFFHSKNKQCFDTQSLRHQSQATR